MATIQVAYDAVAHLTAIEGFSPRAYWDYKQWSIGYGTKSTEGATITHEEALNSLRANLEWRAERLGPKLKFTPTPKQVVALLSIDYNLGSVPPMVLSHLNNGLYSEASMELQRYVYAGGKVHPALVRRRETEGRLLIPEEAMTRGQPRTQYQRVYHVLPQSASIDDATRLARITHEARETMGYSYDDAGIGDLDERVVILHGDNHPDNIVQWYQENYSGVSVEFADNDSDPTPIPSPPPPIENSTPCLVGLHSSADGCWGHSIEAIPSIPKMVANARLDAFKSLSIESPDTIKVLQNINSDIFYMVRLFAKVNADKCFTSDFLQAVTTDAMKWYSAGCRWFEIHNEPNLSDEGMFEVWTDGNEFANWFLRIKNDLSAKMPEARWGFPGLSPGSEIEGRRYNALRFYDEAHNAVSQSDFICAHAYWANEAGMHDINAGQYWRHYDTQGRPLLLTEYSNPNPDIDKSEKGRQYVEYLKTLDGVHSAYSFVATASSGFDAETWADSNIANIIGER
jgi:GH24 family phage-related lysozyme (muramidase)